MNIINEQVSDYIDNLYKPLNSELKDLRAESEERRVPVILRDTEALILNIIRMRRPSRILEIGTAVGYSASCFSTAFSEAGIVSIEADKSMYDEAAGNIKKLGLENNITLLYGKAQDVLADMASDACNANMFDILFIDAAKSHYREFWDAAMPLMKKDGIVISDNVLLKACTASDKYDPTGRFKTSIRRMREFLDYITDIDYADTSVLSVGDGVAVSVLKK